MGLTTATQSSPPFEVHPEALGRAPSSTSPWVTPTTGTLAITTVLLESGTSKVEALPRARTGRPRVYCPFCGRQGTYKKRQKSRSYTEHFAHQGSHECAPTDLANALHARAIRALVGWLARRRERGWPVMGQVECRRCGGAHERCLLQAGAWDSEVIETRVETADGYRVPDVFLVSRGGPALVLEVAHTSLVDGRRLHDLTELEVPGLELLAIDAAALTQSAARLPLPRRVWNHERPPASFAVCDACRETPDVVVSVEEIVRTSHREQPDAGALSKMAALLGVLNEDVGDLGLVASVAEPERFRPYGETIALQLASKPPVGEGELSELALHALGWADWSPWDKQSLATTLHAPHDLVRSEIIQSGHDVTQLQRLRQALAQPLERAEQIAQWTNRPPALGRTHCWALFTLFADHAAGGHTAADVEEVVANVCRRARGVTADGVREHLRELVRSEKLVATRPDGASAVIGSDFFAGEERRASRILHDFLTSPARSGTPARRGAGTVTLSREQEAAVELASRNRTAVITGGPGTGKTTLVRELLEREGGSWVVAAPTWKAVARLTEAVRGVSAMVEHMTVASFIARTVGELPDGSRNPHAAFGPTPRQMIVDEVGCLDSRSLGMLLEGAKRASRLVLLGDPDQLPSVGPGAVLRDLIASQRVPHGRLTEVHRAGQDTGIPQLATSIRNGEVDFSGPSVRLRDVPSTHVMEEVVERYKRAVRADGLASTQILSPFRWLQEKLNGELQRVLNPRGRTVTKLVRVGDPVILNRAPKDQDLVKGETAILHHLDKEGNVALELGEGVVRYLPRRYAHVLHPAYCVTVHKAQGSEWSTVILAMPDCQRKSFLDRPLLYTAVTRARKCVEVVGPRTVVERAARQVSSAQRKTALPGLLAKLPVRSGAP